MNVQSSDEMEADIENVFEGAAVFVQTTLPQQPDTVSQDVKLQLYALYKQATEGDVTGTGPGLLSMDMKARAKWCAPKPLDQVDSTRVNAPTIVALQNFASCEWMPWTASGFQLSKRSSLECRANSCELQLTMRSVAAQEGMAAAQGQKQGRSHAGVCRTGR
jgi:diazepam-binding inhibitor (GABA receptor modulator, acyl-CoA-binding protein)